VRKKVSKISQKGKIIRNAEASVRTDKCANILSNIYRHTHTHTFISIASFKIFQSVNVPVKNVILTHL